VEVSYHMNPATYKVTVTARQAEQDSDYANVLEKSIAKNASSSSETTSEIHVAWNGKTAPSLKHAAEGAAPAPEEGKVSKKLASIYKAWQAKGFDWSSVSWKQLTDDRGTGYFAAQYASSGRVALVWFDGTYYKATFDGADYPTSVDGFDVRDHLLGKRPFYNGERSEKGPVSIMWQEVSAP
jgi:hypothetical protein